MQKFDKIEDALEELKQGKVIIVCDDESVKMKAISLHWLSL